MRGEMVKCCGLNLLLVQDKAEGLVTFWTVEKSDFKLHSLALLVWATRHLPLLLWIPNVSSTFRAFSHFTFSSISFSIMVYTVSNKRFMIIREPKNREKLTKKCIKHGRDCMENHQGVKRCHQYGMATMVQINTDASIITIKNQKLRIFM